MSAVKRPLRLNRVWSHYCDQNPSGPEKRSSSSSSRCVLPRISAADPCRSSRSVERERSAGEEWPKRHSCKKKKKNPTLMGRRRLVQSVGSSSSVCRCVLVAVEVRLMSLQTFFTGGNVLHCHFTEVCSSHTNTHTPFLRLNTCWQAYYH